MKWIQKIWYFSFWSMMRLTLWVYYRKIKVSGTENIPKNTPIIFGANHENALADPLIMTTRLPFTVYYLVRGDVFNNIIVRKFLHSLNLMPIYRMRDGVQSVKMNKQIFQNCFDVFKAGHSLMMYPEAMHDARRVARIANKGIARIALGAMNEPDAPKELYIVPVGISYSAPKTFRSTVHIVYGKAIKVEKQPTTKKYIELLKSAYEQAVKPCYVSLDRDKFPVLDHVFFHNQSSKQIIEPSEINPTAAALLPHITPQIEADFNTIVNSMTNAGLSFPFEKRQNYWWDGVLTVLLSPVALFSLIIHAPILGICWYSMRSIKDKVFNDTIYVGVSFFLMPLWWLTIAKIIQNYAHDWLLTICILLCLPLSLLGLGRFNRHWKLFVQHKTLSNSPILKRNYEKFREMIDALLAKA